MLSQNDQAPKFDAAESAFVARALLYVENELYNTELPPLEGRMYVPVDHGANPGDKFTAYRQYTRTGIARLITERGTDLPNSGLFVKEFVHPFYPLGTAYEYNYFDLLAAAASIANGGPPLNLDMELATSARESIERKLDIVSAVGSGNSNGWALEDEVDVGLLGLSNQPNATLTAVPVSAGSGLTPWANKSPDEILADLSGIVSAQISSTFKLYKPNTILLPVQQMEYIRGVSMGDGRSDTVLSYFQRTNLIVKEIDSWNYLKGAGVSGTDRMIAYTKDKRFVRHMIAMEFTQLPVEQSGMTYKVACLAKTAGVISPYPLSISYADGI